jgi:hypothetical protein
MSYPAELGVNGPWRMLIFGHDPADPKWIVATVTTPADVRPAVIGGGGVFAALADASRGAHPARPPRCRTGPAAPARSVADRRPRDVGVILDYSVALGNVADGPQPAPSVERIRRRAGRVPAAVTADHGYDQPVIERDLHGLGADRRDPPPGHNLARPQDESSTAAASTDSSSDRYGRSQSRSIVPHPTHRPPSSWMRGTLRRLRRSAM